MSAEIYIKFKDINYYKKNRKNIQTKIFHLTTFIDNNNNEWFKKNGNKKEIWLKGKESINNEYYDVRFFFNELNIIVEITYHPPSIEKDLSIFFDWIVEKSNVSIEDEDGEIWEW